MSLEHCVLACRRSSCKEFRVQSLVGVAVKDRGTWIFSPADLNVSTPIMRRQGTDIFGERITFEVFTLAAGRFLDEVFPDAQEFEIFRLHYDSYRLQRGDETISGELLDTWLSFKPGEFPQTRILSIEHLWGGYYANRDLLIEKMRQERWHELIYRVHKPLAFSAQEIAAMDFLPHPGIMPGHEEAFSYEISTIESRMHAEHTPKVQQVM
jgi:hypothetical protein